MQKNIGQVFSELNQQLGWDIAVPAELSSLVLTEVYMDSRKVQADGLFVAYKGERYDSHEFLAEVWAEGCPLAIVETYVPDCPIPQIKVPAARLVLGPLCNLIYGTAEAEMDIVAFTGTDGKTTSAQMATHILNKLKLETASIGTIGCTIPGQLPIPQQITSPEPPELHSLLRRIRRAEVNTVMIEAASHAMSQRRYDSLKFKGTVFTNFSQDHMDYYAGDLERYALDKKRLFDELPSESFVVANSANPTTYYMLQDCPAEFLFFQTAGKNYENEWETNPLMKDWDENLAREFPAEFREALVKEAGLLEASNIRRAERGLYFDLKYTPGKNPQHFPREAQAAEVFLPMWGEHNVDNACAALAVALAFVPELSVLAKALSDFPGVPGRAQFIDLGQDYAVVVDFAHTPAGVEALLKEASIAKGEGRLWVTATAAGGRDKEKRLPMGRLYAQYADEIILTSENIYNENPERVLDDLAQAFPPGTAYKRILLRTEAIRYAIDNLASGDIFLILGSAKLYININDQVLPWNEAEYAKNILLERLMREATLDFVAECEAKEQEAEDN